MDEKISSVISALEKNKIKGYYAKNKADALEIIKGLISKGETVSNGGSVTLEQIGLFNLIRNGDYNFLDRAKPGLSSDEVEDVLRKVFFADTFFAGANAITEDGDIFCVDGKGNRISAIIFGPKSVILAVGKNKVVKNIRTAKKRLRNIAAPMNAKRLNLNTPCAVTGKCAHCHCDDRICCDYLVLRQQREPFRIKVIIIDEELGF